MAYPAANRKTKYGEPLRKRIPVLFTDTQAAAIEEKFSTGELADQEASDYIRELFLRDIGVLPPGPNASAAFLGEPSNDVPVLGISYGGPGQEVIRTQISTISITNSMARMLGYQEGDQFLQVLGDSMAGAGVVDGSLVLMSELSGMRPSRGYIVLVQIVSENDEYTSTLKRYMGLRPDGLPKLEDAEGNPFEYPNGTKTAEAIMVARAAITKL